MSGGGVFLEGRAKRKKVIVARSIDSQVQAAEWNEQPSGNQNDWTQWNQTNPFKFIQSHVDLFSSLNRMMPLARCVALVSCGFQSRCRREQCCLGIIIHNSACSWEHGRCFSWAVPMSWMSWLMRPSSLSQQTREANRFVGEVVFLSVGLLGHFTSTTPTVNAQLTG